MMNEEEQDYDVVIDVLEKHIKKLSDMDKGTTELNIMMQIRWEQIDKLKRAIDVWKKYKILCDKQYTAEYSGGPVSDGEMDPR